MSMKHFAAALLIVIGTIASPSAQSLADVVRKADAERAKQTEPAKVYTNADLKADPWSSLSAVGPALGTVPPLQPSRSPIRHRKPPNAPRGNCIGEDGCRACNSN